MQLSDLTIGRAFDYWRPGRIPWNKGGWFRAPIRVTVVALGKQRVKVLMDAGERAGKAIWVSPDSLRLPSETHDRAVADCA